MPPAPPPGPRNLTTDSAITQLVYLANPAELTALKRTVEKGPNEEPREALGGDSCGSGWEGTGRGRAVRGWDRPVRGEAGAAGGASG